PARAGASASGREPPGAPAGSRCSARVPALAVPGSLPWASVASFPGGGCGTGIVVPRAARPDGRRRLRRPSRRSRAAASVDRAPAGAFSGRAGAGRPARPGTALPLAVLRAGALAGAGPAALPGGPLLARALLGGGLLAAGPLHLLEHRLGVLDAVVEHTGQHPHEGVGDAVQ